MLRTFVRNICQNIHFQKIEMFYIQQRTLITLKGKGYAWEIQNILLLIVHFCITYHLVELNNLFLLCWIQKHQQTPCFFVEIQLFYRNCESPSFEKLKKGTLVANVSRKSCCSFAIVITI